MDEQELFLFLTNPKNVTSLFPPTISISKRLDQGGQGIVYKGYVSGVDAAIKVYFPGQLPQRFDREIDALRTLNNPNIVKILWTGELSIDGVVLPIIATTFIPGTNLAERIQGGKLNHHQISILAYDIASAIEAMWTSRSKIVHRDLKPANIMITQDQRACVIDLGIARHINRTPLTTLGSTWGTSGYMSPEQSRARRQLTFKSDIFALGVILVECAMGRHPTRNDQDSLLAMNLHENLPYEIRDWAHVNLLKNMLHPQPLKRPSPQVIMANLRDYAPD